MTFNKKILRALIFMSALFLSLVLYLTYFQIFKGPQLANSGNNPRSFIKENRTLRGAISDRNGEKLAYSEMTETGQKRIYPYKELYAHVIGYSSQTYGRDMIEEKYNGQLLGTDFINSIFGLKDILQGETQKGADLTLTIDHKMQKKASELLGNRKGAVVAVNPQNGQVLALVSKPTFNPDDENLKENWDEIINNPDSPLLARATSGLYPPGSSFKTIIAAAAVEKDMVTADFEDTGSIIIEGKEFLNYSGKIYGELDINKAFAVSCNTFFIDLAHKMGGDTITEIAKKFLFNRALDFDIPMATSSVLTGENPVTEVAAAGMGQGDTLATPLQMALTACAVANDGIIMKPYIVNEAVAPNGVKTYTAKEKMLSRAVSPFAALSIKEMMRGCVEYGTGMGAQVSGTTVYGKTGTAENDAGADHAWFICFAEYESEKIALAVMVEHAGATGSDICVPVARELIREWKSMN